MVAYFYKFLLFYFVIFLIHLKCFYSDTFIACILIVLMGVGNTEYRWPEEDVRVPHSRSCEQPAINC